MSRKMTGVKILVVDDDPDLARALAVRLTHEGYAVRNAYDGVQAMEQISKDPPHLIILDHHLPAGSGCVICEHLQRDPGTRGIPVIMITADPSSEVAERCLGLGVAGFLRKPYDPHRLVGLVHQALWAAWPDRDGGAFPRAA